MIDEDLFKSYPVEIQGKIREAIVVLATTGVLNKQRERNFARIAEGADNEDMESLSIKILDYRRQSHGLLSLQQLGERFVNGE